MSLFRIFWTPTLVRTARKCLHRHPDLEGELVAVLSQLEIDPFAPRLRLHPLKGKLRGKHAVSLTYSHCIVLLLIVEKKKIVLLDMGTHDEVYQ